MNVLVAQHFYRLVLKPRANLISAANSSYNKY